MVVGSFFLLKTALTKLQLNARNFILVKEMARIISINLLRREKRLIWTPNEKIPAAITSSRYQD